MLKRIFTCLFLVILSVTSSLQSIGEDFGESLKEISDNSIQLLKGEKFSELEQKILLAGEINSDNYISKESTSLNSLYFAKGLNNSHSKLFDKWLSAYPTSYVPYLAKGVFLYHEAWKLRGGGFSDTIAKTNYEKIENALEESINSINKSLEINPDSLVAYFYLMEANSLKGNLPMFLEVSSKALKKYPNSFILYSALVNRLQPKWYGNMEIINSLLAKIKTLEIHNPKLKYLQIYPALIQADELVWSGKKYYESLEIVDKLIRESEDKSQVLRAYELRVTCNFGLKQSRVAYGDIQLLLKYDPYSVFYNHDLSSYFYNLGDYKKAKEFNDISIALNPYSQVYRDQKSKILRKLRN